jgi:hypothetical protein
MVFPTRRMNSVGCSSCAQSILPIEQLLFYYILGAGDDRHTLGRCPDRTFAQPFSEAQPSVP